MRRRALEELERRLMVRLAVFERESSASGHVGALYKSEALLAEEAVARLATAKVVAVDNEAGGLRLTVVGRLLAEDTLQRELLSDGHLNLEFTLHSLSRTCAICGRDKCIAWCVQVREDAAAGAVRRPNLVRDLTPTQIAEADRRQALPNPPPVRHLVRGESLDAKCGRGRPKHATDQLRLVTCPDCFDKGSC